MKKSRKANVGALAFGILTFFLFFSPVYSYSASCCGHSFMQDMAVADFIIGIPSCTGRNWADFLAPPLKITFFFVSIWLMVVGLKGVELIK